MAESSASSSAMIDEEDDDEVLSEVRHFILLLFDIIMFFSPNGKNCYKKNTLKAVLVSDTSCARQFVRGSCAQYAGNTFLNF